MESMDHSSSLGEPLPKKTATDKALVIPLREYPSQNVDGRQSDHDEEQNKDQSHQYSSVTISSSPGIDTQLHAEMLTAPESSQKDKLMSGRIQQPPRGWTEISRLGGSKQMFFFEIFVHILLIVMILPLVILAVILASVHGQQVKQDTLTSLNSATKAASTYFSIIFAAVVGRAALKYATRRLEQGATVGFLELLVQSQTVASAITTQFQLRFFSPLGLAIILLWALSPIGSQAVLRVLSTTPLMTSEIVPYVDTTSNAQFVSSLAGSQVAESLDPLYMMALLGPSSIKNGTTDTWGNVKIPFLPNNGKGLDDTWLSVQLSGNVASDYSSLMGIPIGSIQPGSSSFTLESSYVGLDCSTITITSKLPVVFDWSPDLKNGTFRGQNVSLMDSNLPPEWGVAVDYFTPDPDGEGISPESFAHLIDVSFPQSKLLFYSPDYLPGTSPAPYFISQCEMNQVYVESQVTCLTTESCRVTAQRPSQQPHPTSNLTSLNYVEFFHSFCQAWITATGMQQTEASLAEYYLQDPSTSFILGIAKYGPTNFSAITPMDLGIRLSQLLNTYLTGSQTVGVLTLSEPVDGRTTVATIITPESIYVCSWPWFAVLLVCTLTLLSAALFSAWNGLHTNIPDVLGYFSSLTRNTKYLDDVVPGGGSLDGLERARLLKQMRVRMGVTYEEREDGVGSIVLGKPEDVARPRRGAMYR